ncbi:unnamed protein product [Cunninghamella echinulata]
MTKVFCYINFKIQQQQQKEDFKKNCLFDIEFIDKPDTSTSTIIKTLHYDTNSLALIWESENTILLIKKNEQPKKYEIDNEHTLLNNTILTKDISALSVPTFLSATTATTTATNKNTINSNKVYHMLYLTVLSSQGEINDIHKYMIEKSVLQCIQQQENDKDKEYGLFVLLNLPNISHDYFQSIQTQQQWQQWQACITHIYMTQVSVAYQHNYPLFDMNIILPMICGYDVALQHDVDTIFVLPQDIELIQQWNQRRQGVDLHPLQIKPLEVPYELLESSLKEEKKEIKEEIEDPLEIFDKVAVGGTFDHLHAGHKILLTMTALSTKKSLIVGVTDDIMLASKKHREFIASTHDRIIKVKEFLHRIRNGLDYSIVPITDPFGPTITDPDIQALVCSHETLKGSQMVNIERIKRNFEPLVIKIIDVISSNINNNNSNNSNWSDKISSSWIRQYLFDRQQK